MIYFYLITFGSVKYKEDKIKQRDRESQNYKESYFRTLPQLKNISDSHIGSK